MFKQSRILALMLIGGACIPFYLNAGSMDESAADTTFGTNGKVLEVLSEDQGGARHNAPLVQDDDKVIAAGTAKDSDDYTVITLYRYLKDGSRDTSFGNQGVTVADHIYDRFSSFENRVICTLSTWSFSLSATFTDSIFLSGQFFAQ